MSSAGNKLIFKALSDIYSDGGLCFNIMILYLQEQKNIDKTIMNTYRCNENCISG